jgi:hypothetical protein
LRPFGELVKQADQGFCIYFANYRKKYGGEGSAQAKKIGETARSDTLPAWEAPAQTAGGLKFPHFSPSPEIDCARDNLFNGVPWSTAVSPLILRFLLRTEPVWAGASHAGRL